MGRKNRKKPFKCPIPGCEKRGQISDLKRHRDAVHPELLDPAGYVAAIGREPPAPRPAGYYLRHPGGPGYPGWIFNGGPASGGPPQIKRLPSLSWFLSVITIVGLVAWVAFFR